MVSVTAYLLTNFCVQQRQVKEGIDAVIVDNVLAIRKGLTGTETAALKDEEVLDALEVISAV